MEPTHSALIVAVPEAEPVVGELRQRLDRAASWGVPAHVTVLYPFLPPARLTRPVLDTVGRIAAGAPRFFVRFAELDWFGERVLWLAPDPAQPLRELTHRLAARFPEAPPYGGEFTEVTPHLTSDMTSRPRSCVRPPIRYAHSCRSTPGPPPCG